MTVKNRVASAAVGLVVVLAVLVVAFTDDAIVAHVCYLGVMVGASIGAWVGSERAPPGRRLIPRLIATGVSLTAVGDVTWTVLDEMGADTDVSIADPPWFAAYIFLCAALWVVLGRSRRERRVDLDFVIDVVTIVAVTVLIVWSVSVDAIVGDRSLSPLVRTVWAAYPIADAVVLALVVRILMSRSARAAIDPAFAVGVSLWLAADIAYLRAPEDGVVPLLMDAAWMIAPVLLARAAWSVRDVEVEVAPSGSSSRSGWVAQLTIAVGPLFVPPALELTADLRGQADEPVKLFVGTTVLITLAFVRTARLMRSEERAVRELEVARDRALDASRAKSMFLANMSHEIRTPLTTVLATAEILEDTPLNGLQLKLLAKMHRSGVLLKSLVEKVLDFSRIEAGQIDLTAVEFDLHTMVGDLADVYVSRAGEEGILFEWQVDPGVPGTVVGDPARLFQIVSNLLDNAFKFTDKGRVGLTVRAAPGVGDEAGQNEGGGVSDGVVFAVEDNGIGIDGGKLASLFESFNQVDGSTTRRYGGSGLGLAICRELTELMGGYIAVASELGSGSTFAAHIPLPPATHTHPVVPETPDHAVSPLEDGRLAPHSV